MADYFTKHHPPAHHVNVRSKFLTKVKDLPEARRQRLEQGQTTKPHKAQATTSYKGVLDSEEQHTISSEPFSEDRKLFKFSMWKVSKREVFE